MEGPLHELIEIIQFTETVSGKIHGVMDEAEIYKIVKEEFVRSGKYNMAIYLLTDDGSKLKIAETSLHPTLLNGLEKTARIHLEDYRIDLDKSSTLGKVVREGETIQTRASQIINEILPKPLRLLLARSAGFHKELSVMTPLKLHGKTTGVFAMSSTELAEDFIPSVRNLTRHISTSLELAGEYAKRKKVEERINQRNRELTTLNVIATTMMQSALDLDEVLQRIADAAVDGFGCNSAVILLLDEKEGIFKGSVVSSKADVIKSINTIVGFPLDQLRFPARTGYNEAVSNAMDGRVTIKHDLYELAGPALSKPVCAALQRLLGSRTFLGMPLMAKGKVVGCIIATTREEIGEKDIETMMTFANQAAIAIDNARLYKAARQEIFERKRAEEELKTYSENLEELVEERTKELKEAERMAVIGETTTMVGHDLRNPLQAIVNNIYLAKKKVSSLHVPEGELELKQRLQTSLETIGERVGYMNKIVLDLQDYSRPVKPKLIKTDMRQLIDDSISTVTIPETIKISIRIDEEFRNFIVDPWLMKRIFINLITNAVQAMPRGGKLTIESCMEDQDILIKVRDTGVGIPEENLYKIFNPLFTTKSQGQGFGLPVCKRLVEAHGGSLSVESKLGKGSIFTVRVPLVVG